MTMQKFLDFILFVLTQAQCILVLLAFGFYCNLVTCIKLINSLIKLKSPRDFQNFAALLSACFMHDASSGHIHISNLLFSSPFSLHFSRRLPLSLQQITPSPLAHPPYPLKGQLYCREILTPYLPSPQLESCQTDAADTSQVVFPNFK